jgi:hypothetical protein
VIPNYVDPRLVAAEDGSEVVTLTGIGSDWPIPTTVIAIDADSFAARTVSSLAMHGNAKVGSWGSYDLSFENQDQLALSPNGARVAYVEKLTAERATLPAISSSRAAPPTG